MALKCSSCKRSVTNQAATRFPAPQGDGEIVRCKSCRQNAVKYETTSGFVGPN